MPIQVEILYNDSDETLFCANSKERIQLGQKFAYLLIDNYDGEIERIPYLLENLPTEDEVEE